MSSRYHSTEAQEFEPLPYRFRPGGDSSARRRGDTRDRAHRADGSVFTKASIATRVKKRRGSQ